MQTKAQGFFPTMMKTPHLNKVPLQPDFQDDKFQGKWYALGVADSPIRNGSRSQLTMYSVNYELKDEHSFNVNTTMLSRGKNDFTIYAAGTGGILSYVMRVAATNYKQFAMVYVEKNVRFKWHFQATLYGRTKKLSHKLKERFVKFSKSVDFTEDNIAFFVPIVPRAVECHSCGRGPKSDGNQFKMHSITCELQDDHSYNLTATMLRCLLPFHPLFFLSLLLKVPAACPPAAIPVKELEDPSCSAPPYTDRPNSAPSRSPLPC
ncbi:Neutrophil gelatinase-associated lipocalin [Fukomys damarensis]|uniref:Neutrophil gelatinase-associated lipocalin n=1 Tax=Fukomys damarensis TaxID=885580 RepID=A0A091DID1_FUKDA|nr:Neutrophil gelatinase-associated lipocalin [Fukomys damarensis]